MLDSTVTHRTQLVLDSFNAALEEGEAVVLTGGRAEGPARLRDAATVATTVLAARSGAWGVRVHDVAASADAVRVVGRASATLSRR